MGQKILVVEDNELNLKLFCDLLRAHGYEAEPVRDGREAVARTRELRPDLIVMDIQMPHITGLELIEQMKADSELKAIPIMAVTAYAAKGDEERIRDAGAEGYVSKPISLMKFIDAVRGLLAVERRAPVRVVRRFETSCERLFDAWLDAETVGEWIYEEIDRPRRLVFTLQVPLHSDDRNRVTIELEGTDEGCKLVLDAGTAPPAEAAEYEQGWLNILDGLAKQLGEDSLKEERE